MGVGGSLFAALCCLGFPALMSILSAIGLGLLITSLGIYSILKWPKPTWPKFTKDRKDWRGERSTLTRTNRFGVLLKDSKEAIELTQRYLTFAVSRTRLSGLPRMR